MNSSPVKAKKPSIFDTLTSHFKTLRKQGAELASKTMKNVQETAKSAASDMTSQAKQVANTHLNNASKFCF